MLLHLPCAKFRTTLKPCKIRLVVNSVWSPSVKTGTQVSRWFDIDCSTPSSTILLCLILTDLDIMWFIAWRAICTHALGHARTCGLECTIPLDHLLGFIMCFHVQSIVQSTSWGGFSAIPAGLIIHSRLWEALVSATSLHILCLALTAEARLLRRDQGAEKHGYFWKKVMLSCCQTSREVLKRWGIARDLLVYWNIRAAAATTKKNNVKMHGLIIKGAVFKIILLLHSCSTKTNRCRNKLCLGYKGQNIDD